MSAVETLALARAARGAGDVGRCLVLSAAAQQEARHEHAREVEYRAAEVPGRLFVSRAEPREALGHYRNALDVALTHGLTFHLAGAYHDLALAVREAGDQKRFRDLAAVALRLYLDTNPRHPGLTGLLADMAAGDFESDPDDREKAGDSLHAWIAVPSSMKTPKYKLAAAAQQMRAAAVLGLQVRYGSAASALFVFLDGMPDHEGAAATLAYAAGCAVSAGDFPRALEIAEKAERIGVERGEDAAVAMARAALDAAEEERNGVRLFL